MKKLFLLLFMVTSFLQAQTLQNPTFGTVTTKTSPTVTDDPYVTTTGTTGVQGKIAPVNLLIPYTPVNYSLPTQTIGNHLAGIDTRLGQISSTTAGITQRVYFTADNTTVNSVVYFASSLSGKGSTASGSPPALVLSDNTKAYFTKDIISIAQPSPTIGYAGTYSGNLTVSATPTPVATQQRFTVEIYRTDNLGNPIASGVSGAPVGDLGATVLAILDSGIINLSAGSITNVPVSGILTQNVTINTGERLRYHVSAAKIGSGGGNVTFGVYYGNAYNSYYDVPVAIRSNAVLDDSDVPGAVTVTDALNTLNTSKANDSEVLHKTGDALPFMSTAFNPVLSQNPSTLNIEKRVIQPEGTRLSVTNTSIFAWGDSLTAGAGATGGLTYPYDLSILTNFTITNKGVGGETSTQIKDRLVADTGNYDKSVIIWAGRNNYSDPTTVKADIATMVSTLGHDRYIIVSVTNGEYSYEYKNNPGWVLITQLNTDLKAIYGAKFVDVREYLVSLHDNTTQGLLDFSRDIVPYNLRTDPVHLNNQGYQYVAEYINRRLNILFGKNDEYLQAKDFSYYNKIYSANSSILNQASSSQNANYWINGLGIVDGGFISRNGTEAGFGKTHYRFQNNASTRFSWVLTGLETGSNAGSNLALICQNDSGTTLSNIVTFFRNTSNVLIRNGVGTPLDNGVDRLQVDGTILSAGFKKISGTSSQILMADGSVSTILSGSATLDFPSTGAGSSSEINVTVAGADEGDVVALGITNSAVLSNSCYTARVSAANTVTVRFNNYSSSSADPASGTFKVKVLK